MLDMGSPVRIGYLAEQMIRLSGKEPGKDIEIQYVGLRPGEKLYEELFYGSEGKEATGNKKSFGHNMPRQTGGWSSNWSPAWSSLL